MTFEVVIPTLQPQPSLILSGKRCRHFQVEAVWQGLPSQLLKSLLFPTVSVESESMFPHALLQGRMRGHAGSTGRDWKHKHSLFL